MTAQTTNVVSLAERRLAKLVAETERTKDDTRTPTQLAELKDRVHSAYLRVVAEITANHPHS